MLADACRGTAVPIVAVLGNHDHHAGRARRGRRDARGGGVVVLERSHRVLEVADLEVGVVGTKGFVGGFPGAEIPDFGEPLLRRGLRRDDARGRGARGRARGRCRLRPSARPAPLRTGDRDDRRRAGGDLGLSRLRSPRRPARRAPARRRLPRPRPPRAPGRRDRHRARPQRRAAGHRRRLPGGRAVKADRPGTTAGRPGAWAILRRAVDEAREDRITTSAQALAYSLFLAIPATPPRAARRLLARHRRGDVARLVERLESIMPPEAAELLGESLERSAGSASSGMLAHRRRARARALDDDVRRDGADGRDHDRVRRHRRAQLRPQAAGRARDRRLPRRRRAPPRRAPDPRPAPAAVARRGDGPGDARRLGLVDGAVAAPARRPPLRVRRRLDARPGEGGAAEDPRLARRARRAGRLARRLGRARALQRLVRVVREDVGHALGGRRHARSGCGSAARPSSSGRRSTRRSRRRGVRGTAPSPA